jgi:phenylalanyl-tRNA synthetase beta chain
MRISWKWLTEFVDLSTLPGCKDLQAEGPKALGDLLTSLGLEVEGIERQNQGFENVVTAQILKKDPHPQADRLSLCQVSTGSGEPLEIVCGAQNMKAGDKIALAQIGALLPNGIKITQSKIRGVVSNGMLCSAAELKLSEESDGLMILPSDTPLGIPVAKVLGKDDTILTLKLTANRGDCLSHYGIAREVAAALGQEIKRPEALQIKESPCPITIELEAGENSPQFFGCFISGVKVGPSPQWLVQRLEALGSRSVNNVVDCSNLVMLELGHPTHAYDASQIKGGKIQVRLGRQGEKLPLLDDTTVELQGFEIVIADQQRSVGLAGVMGGGNSQVLSTTRDIFLECAEFDPSLVRKAAGKHQRKTDASHRFERGVDPEGLPAISGRVAFLILQLAGGTLTGASWARLPSRSVQPPAWRREIRFKKSYLNTFLGFDAKNPKFSPKRMIEILKNLHCEVQELAEEWIVIPPSYRLDLKIKEDIAEEIARSVGFSEIPATLPVLTSSPVFSHSSGGEFALIERVKDCLKANGLMETLNYSFTNPSWLSQLGMKSSIELLNPLSEELKALVPSLLPGLIRNAIDNWHRHFGSEQPAVRLFEIRPVFSAAGPIQAQGQLETGVQETWKMSWVLSGPRFADGLRSEKGELDFYDLKATVDGILTALGTKGVRFQPFTDVVAKENPLFHPGKSAIILAGNRVAGVMGLMHPAKAQELKTRAPLWMVELDWQALTQLSRKPQDVPVFKPWPAFPPMERDFALVVKGDVTAETLCQSALKAGKPLAKSARVFDIYKGTQVAEGMTSVAVRVIFYDESRSPLESEAEAVSARIVESWKKEFGADLRK